MPSKSASKSAPLAGRKAHSPGKPAHTRTSKPIKALIKPHSETAKPETAAKTAKPPKAAKAVKTNGSHPAHTSNGHRTAGAAGAPDGEAVVITVPDAATLHRLE